MQSFFVTPTDNTCYIYCLASEVYNQRESNRKLLNKFSIAMVGNKYLSSHYVDIFKAIEQVYHLGSHPIGLELSLGVITRVVYALRVRRIIWYYNCSPTPIQELIHPAVFMRTFDDNPFDKVPTFTCFQRTQTNRKYQST